jgi:hypothetical protein
MWQKNDPKGYASAVNAGTVDAAVKVFSKTLKKKLKEIKIEVSKDQFDDTPFGSYESATKTATLYPYSRMWKQAEVDVKAGQFAGDRPTWIDRGTDAQTGRHEIGHGVDNLMWEILDQGGGSNLTFQGIKPSQGAVWSANARDFVSSTLPSITKISEIFQSDKRVGSANRRVETPEFKEHIDYLSRPQEIYVRLDRLKRFMLENNLTVRQVIKRYEDGLIKEGFGQGTKKPWAESVGGKKFEDYDLPKEIVAILEPMLEHRNHLAIKFINQEGHSMMASGKGGGSGMVRMSDRVPDNIKAILIEDASFRISSMLDNALREIAIEAKHLPTEMTVGVDKGMIGAVEAAKATSEDDPLGLGE